MIYKNTSVKSVIAKVFTDLNLQEESHRIEDMIEWAGEALEKIGAFPQFENKVTGQDGVPILKVSNYQVKLPCDFYRPIQLSFSQNENGPFYSMRYATGNFDWAKTSNKSSSTTDTIVSESAIVTLAMTLYDLSYEQALAKVNSEPTTKAKLNSMLVEMGKSNGKSTTNFNTTSDYTYLITSGYIKTNMKDGYIMMAYQAIPTDSEGYPLVPDDDSFKEALYWYITVKLIYPDWKNGRVRDAVYYDARRSWNYYSKQAYGNALMPNQDEMESIKNSWNRLVPIILEHKTGFSTLGQRQVIYNNN